MPSNKDGCSRRAVEVEHWEGGKDRSDGGRGRERLREGKRGGRGRERERERERERDG